MPPRVLLIRPSALGDVARTVPALATLHAAMPGASIDWLVHDAYADVIRHHPMLSGVIEFPRRRFARFLRERETTREVFAWARRLRDAHYDLAIDLQGLFRSGLFTRLTRAPRRVGFANAREMGWLGYNARHRVDRAMHTVDRMLALCAAEGFTPVHDMRLYVGDDDRAWLGAYLAERQLRPNGYAVLAPTARWLSKCWPIDRFTEIARRLLDTRIAGAGVIVLASPSERAAIQPLLDALRGSGIVDAPATTVGQMMAILSQCRLLVCNDSAALHVAVGFDRPLVALFGPTNPRLVGPYRRPDAVLRPPGLESLAPATFRQSRDDQSIISRLTVDEVWGKVKEQVMK